MILATSYPELKRSGEAIGRANAKIGRLYWPVLGFEQTARLVGIKTSALKKEFVEGLSVYATAYKRGVRDWLGENDLPEAEKFVLFLNGIWHAAGNAVDLDEKRPEYATGVHYGYRIMQRQVT